MEIRYEKHWSSHLNREMEFKIYGSTGKPVLFIPCQAGRFWDFEGFNMDKTWAPYVSSETKETTPPTTEITEPTEYGVAG